MIRSFVGIGIPDHAARHLVRLQSGCPGRPVDRENLHLTLVFLDSQPVSALEDLDVELAAIRTEPPRIMLKGLDLFGTGDRGGVAALVERDLALSVLHEKVVSAVRRTGIRAERRKFWPHVTFCRFSRPPDPTVLQRYLDTWSGFDPVEFSPADFTLFRSTLKKSGAVYDSLADYPLGGNFPTYPVGY